LGGFWKWWNEVGVNGKKELEMKETTTEGTCKQAIPITLMVQIPQSITGLGTSGLAFDLRRCKL
jgi:hypothetical protein